MKIKTLLIAAVGVLFAGFCYAGIAVVVPAADTAQQADVNYGGVDQSTSAFNVLHTTATIGESLFYGVNFSTGASSDFVDVWDSTGVPSGGGSPGIANLTAQRFYNVNATTGSATSPGITGAGFNGPKYPVKMYRGIVWKPSSAAYNSIILYYWKRD